MKDWQTSLFRIYLLLSPRCLSSRLPRRIELRQHAFFRPTRSQIGSAFFCVLETPSNLSFLPKWNRIFLTINSKNKEKENKIKQFSEKNLNFWKKTWIRWRARLWKSPQGTHGGIAFHTFCRSSLCNLPRREIRLSGLWLCHPALFELLCLGNITRKSWMHENRVQQNLCLFSPVCLEINPC